ncbi:hypothetical protein M422DRAFT_258704 [Sphaerobolus stellatus SS14]|uniref:HAT C-terminal dimerisation domain-containing protein n=1 Tax=Sphaerobolus stellatus (strain SS14) TaxID=990650 RepID=A0A0C9VLT8_SPHS4|nr:hypothetical protein M422DRAFT_258704 [Sphaerobolus stellatus SS14]
MLKQCSCVATEEAALDPDLAISGASISGPATLSEALSKDPMAKLQYCGNDVRVSQLKHHKFRQIIEAINGERARKAELYILRNGLSPQDKLPQHLMPLKDLMLYRHIVNRWGTALAMIGCGTYLGEPLEAYSKIFLAPKYHISPLEWDVLSDIYSILEPLNAVQTLMSAEATPVMSFYITFYYGLISTLKHRSKEPRYQYLSEVLQAAISKLDENMGDMRFSKAVILSVIIHPALRFNWIKDNWPAHRLPEAQRIILKELQKYDRAVQEAMSLQHPQASVENGFNVYSLLSDKEATSAPPENTVARSGLEAEWTAYCYASNLPDMHVDLVKWWQDHQDKFPRLFQLALDYLPAQASYNSWYILYSHQD